MITLVKLLLVITVVSADSENAALNVTNLNLNDERQDVGGVSLWYILGCVLCLALLGVTLLLYLFIPKLRNVHGSTLCNFILGLIALYLSLLVMNMQTSFIPCGVQGYMFGFSIAVSVFWMNVMCFNCYTAFRNAFGDCSEKKRLLISCLYGWGFPLAYLGLNLFLELAEFLDLKYKPPFSTWRCDPVGDKTADFLYFFLPLLLLMLINAYFLSATACRVRKLQELPKNAVRVDKRRNHERFTLTWRIFATVSIAFVLDMTAWAIGNPIWLHNMSSVYVYLQGGIIFLLCVCNPDVKQCIVNRHRIRNRKRLHSGSPTSQM